MLPALFVVETSEIRWFYQGEIPEIVLDWYDDCPGEKVDEPERTDRYFVGASPEVGIKIREGRLELKRLIDRTETIAMARVHTAYQEEWRKWSFRLAVNNDGSWAGIDSTLDWIDVSKLRSLRFYQPTAAGILVPKETAMSEGCQLELSRIQSKDQRWWSLGFESTGDVNRRQKSMHLVARNLLKSLRGVDLQGEDCFGYPRWIAKMS
jgi:hypothetical protein